MEYPAVDQNNVDHLSESQTMRETNIDIEGTWQKNLEALARFRPELHALVTKHNYKPVGNFIKTANGLLNLQYIVAGKPPILAYSLEDPWRDVKIHLDTVADGSRGLVVFVGMGLGYGPLLVFNERADISQMVVLEPSIDVFCAALQALDLHPLISAEKVSFYVGDIDLEVFDNDISRVATIQDTHILRHVPGFQRDLERYQPLNDQIFQLVNKWNAHGGTTSQRGELFFRNRLENLSLLRHAHSLDGLKDRFKNKPAILVAAGPSLDKSIPELKKAVGRCVIIAVDSALSPLLRAGITPDFVTTIDGQEANFEKLTPFLGKKWPFSLVALIKTTPLIAKRFHSQNLFYAFPLDRPHLWMMETLGIKTIVPAALSVAHLNLGLALVLGADPIVFVGQDLGYTAKDSDHAAGTILIGKGGMPEDKETEIFYEQGIDGSKVQTDRGMLSLKKQFEDIIKEYSDRTYLNASAAGVNIRGTEVVQLPSLLKTFSTNEVPVTQLVNTFLETEKGLSVGSFLHKSKVIVNKVGKAEIRLKKATQLGAKISQQINLLEQKQFPASGIDDLPTVLIQKMVKFDEYNNYLDNAHELWEHVLELTFEDLKDDDDRRAQNEQILKTKNYLSWLRAELERINQVNKVRLRALTTYSDILSGLVKRLHNEERLLSKAASQNEKIDILLKLVRLHLNCGELVLAKEALDEILCKWPDNVEALEAMGEVCAGLLDLDSAVQYWRQAFSAKPSCAAKIKAVRQANADLWVGLVEEKGSLYPYLIPVWLKRILTLIGDEEDLPKSLQNLWAQQAANVEDELQGSQFEAALKTLHTWELLGGRLPEIHYLKARILYGREDFASALTEVQKALQKRPQEPQWLAFAARVLLECGKFDEGLALLQEAVRIDPQTATLWEELGDTLVSMSDYNNAISAYERCFVALPDRVGVLRKMGDCYLVTGQSQAAIATYEAVLQKAPDDFETRQHLVKAQELAQALH